MASEPPGEIPSGRHGDNDLMLRPGTKLGSFEVVGALGSGGMGEVYRARDIKLNREVALKVLPEAFAKDAERMARFQREAQVLASLNHPNIAAIYGLEESGGVRALVMELVEGPTLAERIAQGGTVGAGPRPDGVSGLVRPDVATGSSSPAVGGGVKAAVRPGRPQGAPYKSTSPCTSPSKSAKPWNTRMRRASSTAI
jgi:hypothetical protein